MPSDVSEKCKMSDGWEAPSDINSLDVQLFMSQNGTGFQNWLQHSNCHLDPDFRFSTYGDGGQRATRIRTFFEGSQDNFIVFYASFATNDIERKVIPSSHVLRGESRNPAFWMPAFAGMTTDVNVDVDS
ncbi:MAG: hypothetical protein KGJ59_09010 [Bacteroidota bacterium]|nr:hypothetical protein [Bacteroidota bacterium]